MLVNERLHATLHHRHFSLSLRVEWKFCHRRDTVHRRERINFVCRKWEYIRLFFTGTLREDRYRYPIGKSTLTVFPAASRRFVGALTKCRWLLKLIKRSLFAPISVVNFWWKSLRFFSSKMVYQNVSSPSALCGFLLSECLLLFLWGFILRDKILKYNISRGKMFQTRRKDCETEVYIYY